MATMQKQKEINICGLYAVAVTTAIAHDVNPSKLLFKEDQMRHHLSSCFEEGFLSIFPTLYNYVCHAVYIYLFTM